MTQTKTAAKPRNAPLTIRLAMACRDPRHHCALVLAANAGLVACGATEPLTPALVLHLILLPFNAWRLANALRAAASTRRLPAATFKADVLASRARAAAMRAPAFDASGTQATIRLSARPAR